MSYEIECTLLAALVEDASGFATLDLQESDFHYDQTKAIFKQIKVWHEAGTQPDAILIWEGLQNTGDFHYFNGLGDLSSILMTAHAVRNIKTYTRIVKASAKKNALHDLAFVISGAVEDDEVDIAERLARVRDAVGDFEASMEVVQPASTTTELLAELDEWLHAIQQYNGITGINTEIDELNLQTDGLQDGYLYIVAGRPSMGKTMLGTWLALAAAKKGKKTHFVTLEMAKKQITLRMIAALSGLPMTEIRKDRYVIQAGRQVLDAAKAKFATLPLVVSDRAVTLGKICSLARRERLRRGLDLLVIDQLSAMSITGSNRATGLKEITGALKQLAKELGIPIVLLHQLSRAVTHLENKRPDLEHLKDSGAVEEDADVVMLLHRPAYYNIDLNPELAEIIMGKNRDGMRGVVIECGMAVGSGKFSAKA